MRVSRDLLLLDYDEIPADSLYLPMLVVEGRSRRHAPGDLENWPCLALNRLQMA